MSELDISGKGSGRTLVFKMLFLRSGIEISFAVYLKRKRHLFDKMSEKVVNFSQITTRIAVFYTFPKIIV
jgi:hypothetical protein